MKHFDLSLYLITDRRFGEPLDILPIVEEAVEGGVTIVQLRDKDLSVTELKKVGEALLRILRPLNIPLIVNDFPEIAKAIGADGVHLGQKDMHPSEVRKFLGSSAIIGLSIENLSQLVSSDLSQVDYVGAGPIFSTLTKKDSTKPIQLNELRALRHSCSLPLVAIGGIHAGNFIDVLATGVNGIAVASAICHSASPKEAARRLVTKSRPKTLTIAGSDSSGGAGIQADLKTFQALGCYGMSVITALTAQNTREVRSIFPSSPEFVREQIDAVLTDIGVDAVKIGMLFSREIIEVVAQVIEKYNMKNVVLDPVMIAKSGDNLLLPEAVAALRTKLLPISSIITPNLPEAETLTAKAVSSKREIEEAASILAGEDNTVVIKGGHSLGITSEDFSFISPDDQEWISYPRITTPHTHGTGCTFSAAITAFLARGLSRKDAVRAARAYLQRAIEEGAKQRIGSGNGPVDHSWSLQG